MEAGPGLEASCPGTLTLESRGMLQPLGTSEPQGSQLELWHETIPVCCSHRIVLILTEVLNGVRWPSPESPLPLGP